MRQGALHHILDDSLVAPVVVRAAKFGPLLVDVDDRLAIVDAERANEEVGPRIRRDRPHFVDPVDT